MALLTRRRTRPSDDRSSKITTRITRWATIEMWMLSFSPSWKRIENSFSPMRRARPSVAATLPAVSEASDVVSSVLDVADGRDLLAVLVDQEHHLGVGVRREPVRDDSLIFWNSSS